MHIVRKDHGFTGKIDGEMGSQDIDGKIAKDKLTWTLNLSKPVSIKLSFEATVVGDKMSGNVKLGFFGNAALTGEHLNVGHSNSAVRFRVARQ